MKYTVMSSEKTKPSGSEYETKSLLYLMNLHSDSKEIYYFVVDFFNDLTGMNKSARKLWDLQSKGAKNNSAKTIGKELVTLFKNFLSEIDFSSYILFLGGISNNVRIDNNKNVFDIHNIKQKSIKRIKEGLIEECKNKEYIDNLSITDNNIDNFLSKVEFVIDNRIPEDYVKEILNKHSVIIPQNDDLRAIFNEIRDKQSSKKNINKVEGVTISATDEVISYCRHLTSNEIRLFVLQRALHWDKLTQGIPKYFVDTYAKFPPESRDEMLSETQQSCCRAIFNNNRAEEFWCFFESVYNILLSNPKESVNDIYKKIDDNILEGCIDLDYLSFIYLISIIKEGITK